MCLAHYFPPNVTSFPLFRHMSNSEYRAPPNDRARYDMQKELLGTNVTVKLLQCFPGCVSKREGAKRILEEVWSSASVMVLFSRAGLKRIWWHLMQRHCAHRTIAVWHQSTRELQRAVGSHWSIYNNGSACFRIALTLSCHALIVCTVLLQVQHTYISHSVGITKR